MPHRQLATVMPRVMRGRFVPVPVGGEDFIAGQFWNLVQPILERGIGSGDEGVMDLPEHLAPAFALQGGKVVGVAGRGGGSGSPIRALINKKNVVRPGFFLFRLHCGLKAISKS